MTRRLQVFGLISATVAAVACGDGTGDPDPVPGAATAVMSRSIEITTPVDGSEVAGPTVRVRMQARGFTVVAAGDTTPNSGHLHLFLDRELSAADIPIPTEENHIVHMGTGASEYTFEAVAPGEHRLIAVVGDALHVPLQPWVVDTVFFTSR